MSKKGEKTESWLSIAMVVLLLGSTLLKGVVNFSAIFSFIQYLAIAIGFGFFVYRIFKGVKNGSLTKKHLYYNLGAFVAILIASWFSFPMVTSEIVYQGIYLHFPHLIILSIGLLLAWLIHKSNLWSRKKALASIYFALATLVGVGGILSMEILTNSKTAQHFVFEERKAVLETDNSSIRFTPKQVAFNKMKGVFSSSQYQLKEELVNAVKLLDGSFAYVSPTVPDGMINTFIETNDGYLVYNDSPLILDKDRIQRTGQVQTYGEEMEWLDNIWRQLYLADMFAKYTNIIYLQLDDKNPEKRVAVAPKIKYEWKFPFVLVPYWAGVTLVHSDGKVERLNVEEALADTRLINQRIYPSELEKMYTSVQIYDQGIVGGLIKREGKVSIPRLPGNNQMPFYTLAKDGSDYYVTMTVPDGESDALFKIFYINTYTGKRTVFSFDESEGINGPIAAYDIAKSIPGYKFIEEDDSSQDGNFRVIEPTYITKDSIIYLKYSIVPKSYRNVAATVVVDTVSGNYKVYEDQTEFTYWLNPGVKIKQVDTFAQAMEMIEKGTLMIKEGKELLIEYHSKQKTK